jgi:hypothetical protein
VSDYIQREIELYGKKVILRVLTGVVMKIDQRSDSHVSGYGRNSSYNGYGGGNVQISTDVVVTTNIWIRGLSGQEYRLKYVQDISVREGNIIHDIEIHDLYGNRISNGSVMLYNSTTDDLFYTGGMNDSTRNICQNCTRWTIIFIVMSSLTLIGLIYGGVNLMIIFGIVGLVAGHIISGGYLGVINGSKSSSDKKILKKHLQDFFTEFNQISKMFISHIQESNLIVSDKKVVGGE